MLLDAVWRTIVACLTADEAPEHITLPVDVKYQVLDEARFLGGAYKLAPPGSHATLWDIPVTFENVTVGSVRTARGDTKVVHG